MKIAKWTAVLAVLSALALLTAGCAGSTKILGSWSDPSHNYASVKKVAVVGASKNEVMRKYFEQSFVEELAKYKIQGVASFQILKVSDPATIDKDAATAQLRDAGCTHVLVARLVDQQTVQEYRPPTTYAVGMSPGYGYPGWYGGWGSYWSTTYAYEPGRIETSTVVQMESNLYDLASGKLMWSGATQTTVTTVAQKEVKPFVSRLVDEMRATKAL